MEERREAPDEDESGSANLQAAAFIRTTGTATYFFGPFRIVSELEIPPLRDVTGPGRLTVEMRLGAVAPELAGAAVFDEFCQVAATAYLLDIPGVARFLVEDGSRVRVDLAAGAPLADVCSFLLGSVFGALCHQNGLLPLHASAVEHEGEVTAFLGHSGAGKSTLAACLQARGRRVLSDDICLLEEGADGMGVTPVAGWIKLWRQSLDHLGERPDERNRVFVGDDKYRLYLDQGLRPGGPLKLSNVVLLTRAENDVQKPMLAPKLEPLPAVETLSAMMQMTYLAYVVELTNGQARMFRGCAQALREAKGYRLAAPWGLERMDAVLDLLDEKLFLSAR